MLTSLLVVVVGSFDIIVLSFSRVVGASAGAGAPVVAATGDDGAWPLDTDGAFWPARIDDAMFPVAAEKPAGGPDSLKLCEARRRRPLREDEAAGRLGVVADDLRRDCDGRSKPGSSEIEGNGSARSSLESVMFMAQEQKLNFVGSVGDERRRDTGLLAVE